MRIVVILLSIILLSLVILTLKVSIFEHFDNKKEFKKIKNVEYAFSVNQACMNADLIVLHTEWDEFKAIEFDTLKTKKTCKVYDLRNLFDYKEMKKKKIKYYSVGRPNLN